MRPLRRFVTLSHWAVCLSGAVKNPCGAYLHMQVLNRQSAMIYAG